MIEILLLQFGFVVTRHNTHFNTEKYTYPQV